jgi:Fe-S cluster biogenesis protein NfuA
MTPNLTCESKSSVPARQKVAETIAALRPMIQADGGDIEFVDLTDDGLVLVRMHGACVGCPGAAMTLALGVERRLREVAPQIERVVCVG